MQTIVNRYGDVSFTLGGETYTLRVGTLEWRALQKLYKVETIQACIDESGLAPGKPAPIEKTIAFAKVALSRKHPDITDEQVCNLFDCDAGEGETLLVGALAEAILAVLPRLVGGGDPNAQPAATTSESTTS